MSRTTPSLRAAFIATLSAALAFAHPAWALGPLEKNHPTVEAGTQAYLEGRFEDALAAYQAAKKEKPDSAALDFDIGNALYKLGRYEEAREAWLRAANSPKRDLKEKDYYNLGNGFAALNQTKDAIASYRKALTLDPGDEQARHNLEVLLRKLPPKKQDGPDGGSDGGTDGGHPDAGTKPDGGQDGGSDGGQDGGSGQDGGTSDGGSPDGGTPDGGQDGGAGDGGSDGGFDGGHPQKGDGGTADGGQQDGGEGDGEGGADGGADGGSDGGEAEGELGDLDAGTLEDLSRQDAQKLLDSMKRNEKNLQLWRFQQRKKPRNPDEKDW